MPKDPGEKANRLAELRRAWYDRPKQTQTPGSARKQNEPVEDATQAIRDDASDDTAENTLDDVDAPVATKKGRRATKRSS